MTAALALVAGLVGPAAAGWGITCWLDPPGDRSVSANAGRLATAVLVGIGLSSLIAFAHLLAGGSLGPRYVAVDAVALVALGGGAFWVGRRGPRSSATAASAVSYAQVAAAVLVVIALGLSIWTFATATAAAPHGEWDAWAIWNQRARFLLRAGPEWRRAFAPELTWSHTGYPLLLPLAVARLWCYAGETPLAPAVIAAAFAFAAPVALGAAVARAAGNLAGAAAALVLLATAGFTLHGASQYADVPVAALFVAAVGALLHAGGVEGGARLRHLALAGLLLGLGGWTKNEGLAAAACAVIAYVALGSRAQGARVLRDLVPIFAGAALPGAAWLVFHLALVPEIARALTTRGASASVAQQLVDAGRWDVVFSMLWSAFPGSEHHVSAFALGLAIALGVRPRAMARSVPLLAGVLLLCCDVLTYLVTPLDLRWHLGTSASRVLLQAWPVLLLGLFAASARAPAAAPLRQSAAGAGTAVRAADAR